MVIRERCRRLFTPAVLLIFAGCGGGFPATPPAGPVTATSNTVLVQNVRRGASWMAKGATQRDLLYVSNANGTVSVYRYWQHTLVGVLTDFSNPQGECSDKAGNVYITDSGKKKIYEYSHGGKKPISVLDAAPYEPYGCSVNPANGDLAVANSASDEYKPGNLSIYPHGSGTPATYQGPYDDHFINCAYDDRGDLFMNSQIVYYYSFFYSIAFYYLPKHGPKLIAEDLSEPYFSSGWPYVSSIAYDGKYWMVDAISDLYLYEINIKPQYEGDLTFSSSYRVGVVALYRNTLKGRATQVVGAASTRSASAVDYWKYPALGSPIGGITKDLDDPVGLTISFGQHA
ncbi:MAG: hypothetical protein WA814_08615 [Candidatus Baltobacteraceae bacterium]